MRPCFSFQAAAAADKPETLSIYDEIGFWGVQAKDFVTALGKVQSKELNVEINSPGGDVFAALAMFNALKASGKTINVMVMGVAASAASLIAMAGDKIVMPKNTFMMIHNPWSFAQGNADELRDTAATLDKIGSSLKAVYAARTGMDEKELDALLATDTWLTADEALASGFATEVVDSVTANAKFDMARAELPAAVAALFKAAATAPEPAPAEPEVAVTIEAAATAAGLQAWASVFAINCATLDEAHARIKTAREVSALCAVAKKPAAADKFIRANKSVSDVRAALIAEMAADDEATHTDGTVKDTLATGDSAKPKVTPASMWASHNGQPKKGK
jgi:ATP-dependent Clp protease, protease subunit